jgi:hypothetical protein
MATVATTGFIAGFVPHAAEEPIMARRAAAGEFAGVFIFVFVARSVRRNPSLIALPVAFVLFQVADSVYELLRSGNTNDLPPLVVEAIFLSIYAVYAATQLRARRVAPAV